jgi:hypothetical protein
MLLKETPKVAGGASRIQNILGLDLPEQAYERRE